MAVRIITNNLSVTLTKTSAKAFGFSAAKFLKLWGRSCEDGNANGYGREYQTIKNVRTALKIIERSPIS
jgi:hypothetical protein